MLMTSTMLETGMIARTCEDNLLVTMAMTVVTMVITLMMAVKNTIREPHKLLVYHHFPD